MRKLTFIVENDIQQTMLQYYLIGQKNFSRRMITRLKEIPNGMLINGSHARSIDMVVPGDEIEINLPEDTMKSNLSDKVVPIVYEDDDMLVFNKPPFMVVHESKKHQQDTLANVFATYCNNNDVSMIFRPVNRLDRDTSGLLVVAKNQYSASWLCGAIKKQYIAVVVGCLPDDEGIINLPIRRKDGPGIMREVGEGGQEAETHYKVVDRNEKYTMIRVTLKTGRTHQIRAHFTHLGYPLVGDTLYGTNEDIKRQALHCSNMIIENKATGKIIEITAELPNDIKSLF